MTLVEADFEVNLKVANDLRTALRTQPLRYVNYIKHLFNILTVSFVLQFIELNGLEYLLDFLQVMNHEVR